MKGLIAHNDKQKGQSDVADKSRTQVRAHLMLTCPLGFCMFFCCPLIFSKPTFSKKFFQEYDQTVKQFGSSRVAMVMEKFWKIIFFQVREKSGKFHLKSGKFRENEKSHSKSQGISKFP